MLFETVHSTFVGKHKRHWVIATFDDPAIFAEELLQGLLGSFSVEPADKELPRSVCLCHATKSTRTRDNGSLAANAEPICHCS